VCAFVVLDLVSSVLCQKQHLQNEFNIPSLGSPVVDLASGLFSLIGLIVLSCTSALKLLWVTVRAFSMQKNLCHIFPKLHYSNCLQCFDTVGLAAGKASGL